MKFGTMGFENELAEDFIGVTEKLEEESFFGKLFSKARYLSNIPEPSERYPDVRKLRSSINTRDALMHHLYGKV